MAPYDARRIANFLLDQFDSKQDGLTNKKINKLLYYIHAAALIRLQLPLVKNHFEAWTHGPVVAVVYNAFKEFEYRPIDRHATAFDYVTGTEKDLCYDEILLEHRDFIVRVAKYYMRFTADELEDMTHRADGPWATVRAQSERERGLKNRISDELIVQHFQNRFGRREPVN